MVRQAHHERPKRLASQRMFDTGTAVADHCPQATKRVELQVAISKREVGNGSR
jgi:hypothetical protein